MSRLTLDKLHTLAQLEQVVAQLIEYCGDASPNDIPLDCEIELHKLDEGYAIKIHGVGAY